MSTPILTFGHLLIFCLFLLYRKHFPWEDYDEWLFGDDGKWGVNATERPDYLAIQVSISFISYHTMCNNTILLCYVMVIDGYCWFLFL